MSAPSPSVGFITKQSNLRSGDLKLLCVDMSVASLLMKVPTLYFISVSQTVLHFVTFKTVTPCS